LVLAADEASNPQAKPFKQVSLFSDLQSLDMETPFTAETKPASNEYNFYQVHVCISGSEKAAELRLVPFAESGKDGSYFQVWFPKAGAECAKKQ
jgi:hypothetical protein